MIKLNVTELAVTSFAADDGGEVEPGEERLKDTDPRACPYTQGWNCSPTQYDCYTDQVGCSTGGGYAC